MKRCVKALCAAAALCLVLNTGVPALAYTTLKYGSKGTAVVQMQTALKTLGYYNSTLDGKFGSGTQSAVKAFQKAQGLTVDGKAGNATLTLLYSLAQGNASSSTTDDSTLKYGSSGTQVKLLQTELKALGYYTSTVDGKYGNGTLTAVKKFQAANGLTANGTAGSATLSLIAEKYAALNSASSTTTTSTASLKYGSSGDAVKTLQTQLKALGYYTSTVDGKYGSGTVTAVKKFQKANGLTADGVAGSKTRTLLTTKYNALSENTSSTSDSSSTTTLNPNTLTIGSTGDKVKTLQTQLKALGYYTGSIDGSFGQATYKAVVAYQSANGLTADGLAGTTTCNSIAAKYAAQQSTSSDTDTSGASTGTVSGSASAIGTEYSYTLTRTLKRNSSGADVKAVQTRLKQLGYFGDSIDSTYGSSTIAAVTAFQLMNGLTTDGSCGTATWSKMSSASAIAASSKAGTTTTTVSGPGGAKVQLLHWFNDVKSTLSSGDHLLVYDPETGYSWTLRVYSRGRHCDCEPLTAEDTANMFLAFGGVASWGPKTVYVQLPDGRWSLASTHNVAHESYSIKDNNFDGHLCVHFLRNLTEAATNDPNYGLQNQNAIRLKWKSLTGETIY